MNISVERLNRQAERKRLLMLLLWAGLDAIASNAIPEKERRALAEKMYQDKPMFRGMVDRLFHEQEKAIAAETHRKDVALEKIANSINPLLAGLAEPLCSDDVFRGKIQAIQKEARDAIG